MPITIGEIIHTKSEDVKIIEKLNKNDVIIEFIEPNMFGEHTRRKYKYFNLFNSAVKDIYKPTIYGVACKGDAVISVNKVKSKEYVVWFTMIDHCYGPNSTKYNIVTNRWLCYEYFLKDIKNITNYDKWKNDPSKYSFVKVMKSNTYSPETVQFIDKSLARKLQTHADKGKANYKGVYIDNNTGCYFCTVDGDYFGVYDTQEAAANMYNYVITYRGYPEFALNDVQFMTLAEIRMHRLNIIRTKNGNYRLCMFLDKNSNNIDININPEKIWDNKGDPVKVINDKGFINGKHLVDIMFVNTNIFDEHTIINDINFNRLLQYDNKIKDGYKPSVFDVGCYGYPNIDTFVRNREYILWYCMMSRCYNEKDKDYCNYGAAGVSVCKRWQCYEYFLEDLPFIENYDLWLNNRGHYFIDKDIKQSGVSKSNKIYSLETCIFITKIDNNLEKQHRLAIENDTGYVGIDRTESGNYRVSVGNDNYFTFTNQIAAASMYNMVARYRGYNYLNDIDEINLHEIRKYQSTYLLTNKMYKLLDPNNKNPDYDAKFLKMIEDKYMN